MVVLAKINDVAQRYGVSTRTLRYYEQMGLLWSQRPEPDKPRAYAPDALRRLEQILALRRLKTPVREIQRILAVQDPAQAIAGFIEELRSLEWQEQELRSRRELLEGLLAFFRLEQQGGSLGGSGLPEAIVALAERTLQWRERGGPHPAEAVRVREPANVRVVTIAPMRMARYHDAVAPSSFDSWRHVAAWACGYKLPTIRAFGCSSPNPEGIVPKYGYEVLFALPEGFEPRGEMAEVQFPGGLYAVTTSQYRDYVPDWHALHRWVEGHPEYERRAGPFLHELNRFDTNVGVDSLVDLLYPIQPRQPKEE